MESKSIPRKPPKGKLRKKIGFFRWTWNLVRIKYLSNRPHFLWVYRRDNPLGVLGEH